MFARPSSPRTECHFLIVEPDPLFRLLLCVALSGEFSDFHAVADFKEATALLAAHDLSAIVAEYHLPCGSGLVLYEEARRRQPKVPFVLMCGGMRVCLDDPRFCFLEKPFNLQVLVETLEVLAGAARVY